MMNTKSAAFVSWLDKKMLSKIKGKFGYTVLLGSVVFLCLLLALGAKVESNDATPFLQLFYVVLLVTYPAITSFAQCVGSAHAKPLTTAKTRTVYFLVSMLLTAISIGTTIFMVILYFLRY